MLNRLWPSLFLLAFFSCLYQAMMGHPEVLAATIEASFKTAKSAVEIAIGLVGLLCFWLGLLHLPILYSLESPWGWGQHWFIQHF